MGIKHLKANSSMEEILEVIEQDAGVIIDNLLDKNQLKNISEDLKPYLVKTKEGQDDFIVASTTAGTTSVLGS